MKKLAVFLVMGAIIVYYIISMQKVGTENKDDENTTSSIDAIKTLEGLMESIETDYPNSPGDLILLHNEIMSVGYSLGIDDDNVGEYVDVIRNLYSSGFKDINPREEQIEAFKSEIDKNKENSFAITSSDVEEVTVVKSEETGDEKAAEVVVKHSTNQGYIVRTYNVIKEDEKWKIHGWSSEKEAEIVVTEE